MSNILITGRQTQSANKKIIVGAVQNMITGKWWITTTSQSLPERFYEEFAKVQSGKYGEVYARTKFRDDIQTYGKENFNVVQLKTFDNREEAYAHSEKVRAVWLAMGYEMY